MCDCSARSRAARIWVTLRASAGATPPRGAGGTLREALAALRCGGAGRGAEGGGVEGGGVEGIGRRGAGAGTGRGVADKSRLR